MSFKGFSSKSVLIVDDQKPFLLMLKGIIKGMGTHHITTVQSAESGLTACRKEKFDFIIADLHLGTTRKNGYQFLEELRVRKIIKPETVFIMVSGESHRPMVLGSIERSPDDYIIKPFSQAQLINRLQKSYLKRQAFKAVYQEIHHDNYKSAIQACLELKKENSKYRNSCSYLLAEMYWCTEDFEPAQQMLQVIVNEKPVHWAMAALARTEFYLNNHDVAIELAKKVVAGRLLMLEGYDILAHAFLAKGELEEALHSIKKSLDLSPFSMERQYVGATIGRKSNHFDFARTCCKELFEQSKRSVYRDLSHMCNYVRSILDAAEHAEEKQIRNRFQQEAMLTLQRLRNDELVVRSNDDFDYDIYENIITARVNVLDGKNLEAKRTLTRSQIAIDDKFEEYPIVFAPDSIKVMSDLGEFDEARELAQKIQDSDYDVDPNVQYVLDSLESTAQEQLSQFDHYFSEGQRCFSGGKYQAAYEAYEKALELSPVNVATGISILQCITRLMELAQKPELGLIVDCKRIHKLVSELPLKQEQQEEFDKVTSNLSKYLDL
ncbi:MAG: response regulator [Aestuariibacter sp.]